MILPVWQISAAAVVGAYLVRCRIEVAERNRRTWDILLAKLSPGWRISAFREDFAADPLRLSTTYRDAQVMQEIADYAHRRLRGMDRELVESLHRDATYTRYRALLALVRYALTKPRRPAK